MSRFAIPKKIDLTFVGEGWDGCYIVMRSLTAKDFKKVQALAPADTNDVNQNTQAMDAMIDLLSEKFIKGRGFDGENVVDITREDVSDLPVEILTACLEQLAGKLDPKS